MKKPKHKDAANSDAEKIAEELTDTAEVAMDMMFSCLSSGLALDHIVASWASSATCIIELLEHIEKGNEVFISGAVPKDFLKSLGLPEDIETLDEKLRKPLVAEARDRFSQAISIGAMSVIDFIDEMQNTAPTQYYQQNISVYAEDVRDMLGKLANVYKGTRAKN